MLLWLYLCDFILDFVYLLYLVECLGYMITLLTPFCNCDSFPRQRCGSHTLSPTDFQSFNVCTYTLVVVSSVTEGRFYLTIRHFPWLTSAYSKGCVESQLGLAGVSWKLSTLTEFFCIEGRKIYISFTFCLKYLDIGVFAKDFHGLTWLCAAIGVNLPACNL